MDSLVPTLRSLDRAWIAWAESEGFSLRRASDAWVSYDGAGTIQVAPDEELDGEDFLGQILLHELCHHWVEGPASRNAPDWGLDNLSDRHRAHEHAALRLQATLVDRVGLRDVFIATTDFRPYWHALPARPLQESGDPGGLPDGIRPIGADVERSLTLARAGFDAIACSGALARVLRLLVLTADAVSAPSALRPS